MGFFGEHRRQRAVENGYGTNGSNNEAVNAWSDLEQYAGDQHVSWDDLGKEKEFEERSGAETIDSSQNILPRSVSAERVTDLNSQIGDFVDPYQPESGIEAFNFAKRQRKIIAAFESEAGADAMNASDVIENPYWRGQFLQEIVDGTIDEVAEKNFLLAIPSAMEKRLKNETLSRIVEDPEAQRAFWNLSGGHMDEEGLRKLSEPDPGGKDYRTPLDFAEFQAAYLKQFDKDDQNYKKAKDGVNNLKKILYGEEQIGYYEAFESLKQRAYYDQYRENLENQQNDHAKISEQQTMVTSETMPDFAQPAQSGATNENLRDQQEMLKAIPKAESERLLNQAVVDGDPWERSDGTWNLTPEILKNVGLGPKYETSSNGAHVCLSDIYELSAGRQAVVGYVSSDQGVKVRTYYKSNSQGMWRYLPDYVRKDDGSGKASWFGKGYDEASVTLPAEMQRSLAQIAEQGIAHVENQTDPWFVFAGTAKAYNSKQEYGKNFENGTLLGDYYREVAAQPINSGFETMHDNRISPEQLRVSGGLAPDFSKEILAYDGVSSLAGKFRAESFRSEDEGLSWTFCSDAKGRAWVGSVDVKSAPTSIGVGRDWINLSAFETPIYEYPSQDGGYGDQSDRSGRYVGMWKNYLSKVPIIRDYVAWRDARAK